MLLANVQAWSSWSVIRIWPSSVQGHMMRNGQVSHSCWLWIGALCARGARDKAVSGHAERG